MTDKPKRVTMNINEVMSVRTELALQTPCAGLNMKAAATIEGLVAEVRDLEAKLKVAREALEFYAQAYGLVGSYRAHLALKEINNEEE